MQMEDTRDFDCDLRNLGTVTCGVVVAINVHQMSLFWNLSLLNGPRQANLCLRAFRHDKF